MSKVVSGLSVNLHETRFGFSGDVGMAIPCLSAEHSFEGSGSASPNEGMATPCQSAENVDVDWSVRHNIGALSGYAEEWMQNAVREIVESAISFLGRWMLPKFHFQTTFQ